MKTLIFLITLLIASPVLAGQQLLLGQLARNNAGGGAVCADSSCTGFDVCQNFEGVGYDNSESWTETANGGTVDEDDQTATVGRGSYNLHVDNDGNAGYAIDKKTFTITGDVFFHFMIKFVDASPTDNLRYWFDLRDSSNGDLLVLKQESDGGTTLVCGSSTSTNNNIFSDNTWYHVWGEYLPGTGADGECRIYVDNSTTKPAADIEITGANPTNDAAYLEFREYNGTTGVFADQVLVDSVTIGDVCD